MRFGLGFAVLFALVCGLLSLSENAVTLTKANFDKIVKTNDLVMVEFYAPWCGHCKQLAPAYDEAASIMESKGVILGKVDATVEEELAQKYQIQGYPTLKVFQNGAVTDYRGERTSAAIVAYLTKLAAPAVQPLKSKEEFEKFREQGPVVVAFAEASSDLETFAKMFATQYREEFTFGQVDSKELADAIGEKMSSIVLFKPFDELKNIYDGDLKEKTELHKFLMIHKFKVIDEINPTNYKSFVARNLPFSWLFLNLTNEESSTAAKVVYEEVAKGFVGKISFVYLCGSTYKSLAQKLGLSGEILPSLAIENNEGQHFLFKEDLEFNVANLKQFFTSYADGALQPIIKSQPIPENPHDENNVRIVVADNFKEVVLDETKDVLIEFYAPWCGHCKHLEPVYGSLAKDLKDVKSIVIAKTDATENDYAGEFKVQGFPTLKLVTAVSNKVIPYEGARTREGLLEFLNGNCVINFELPKVSSSSDSDSTAAAEGAKDEL